MMAEQDIDQLLAQAAVHMTGAANSGIKAALFEVLAEFFTDSSSWWETLTVTLLPDTFDYTLTVSEGQVVRLAQVTDANGSPVAAVMPVVGTLHVARPPSTAQVVYAVVIKTVTLPTAKQQIPVAPDWVLPLWHVGILDGILGKMMNMPAKSYSNADKAVYHLRRFRKAISDARVSTLRANTHGTQAWRFPQTFSSRSQQGGVPSTANGNERMF